MENLYEYKVLNYKHKFSNIGVVIVAFNRRDYIIDAVKSVLNQRVNGFTYQITVVKNFLDDEIDGFINKNEVNNIYTEKPFLGYKILLGVILTNSPVICLLEDDDIFLENKLSNVYKKFKESEGLVYYHNSMTPINEEKEGIVKWYKQENRSMLYNTSVKRKKILRIIRYGGQNLSSISISRNMALKNVGLFKGSTYNLDYGILLLALSSGKLVLSDREKLTLYRVHTSATNFSNRGYNEFINNKIQIADGAIETLHNLKKLINVNNMDLVNIYSLMLYQYLLNRSLMSFSRSNVSFKEYIILHKYAYRLKDYVKYIPLLCLELAGLLKLKNKLTRYYIKNFMLRSMTNKS